MLAIELFAGFEVPLIAEEELPSITDANIDYEIRKLVDEGCSVIEQSLSTAPDDIKRTLRSPVSSATASYLWKKERVLGLKRILSLRGESTEGLKSELFQRAHPMHAKVLPPPRKKKKTTAQKKEEKDWETVCKSNAKVVKKLFIDWAKRQKNEVNMNS